MHASCQVIVYINCAENRFLPENPAHHAPFSRMRPSTCTRRRQNAAVLPAGAECGVVWWGWLADGWLLASPWLADGWPMTCSWMAVGLPLVCRWFAEGWLLACRWLAVDWLLAGCWQALGLPLASCWPAVGFTGGMPLAGS